MTHTVLESVDNDPFKGVQHNNEPLARGDSYWFHYADCYFAQSLPSEYLVIKFARITQVILGGPGEQLLHFSICSILATPLIAPPSLCRLSVCNGRAPYSGD